MTEKIQENRKYRRLANSIPMECSLAELQDTMMPGLEHQKGTTVNVSQGGLCFETDNLHESTLKYLSQQNLMLDINLYVPLAQKPIRVTGLVSWHKKIGSDSSSKYLIGIKFRSIKKDDLKMLFRQTSRFRYFVIAVVSLMLVFVLSLFYHFVISK